MADIAASVLAKLKNKAKASGISYQQCLQLFFQEEFLRKLAASQYAENFVLKGGLFIYTLTNFESRATVDVGRLYFTKNGGIRRKLFSCVMLSVVPKQISMIFRIRTRVKYRARTAWTIFVPVFSRKLALPSSSSTRKSLCSRRRLTPCRSARLN